MIIKYLKPYKKEFILGPIFKLIEAILELFLPTLMALIIDKGVSLNNKVYIFKLGTLMLLCTLIGLLCAFLCQFMASRASQGVGTDIRNKIFEHIGTFSHKEIDKFGTSSLINRITSDVTQIQLAVAMLIRLVVRAPFLCIGGIVMAMIIDIKLSSIIFISVIIFSMALYLIMKKTIPLYKMVQIKLDSIALKLRENLIGVKTIRAFGLVELEKQKFKNITKEYNLVATKALKILTLTNPLTNLIINFAIIFVLWFGGIRSNVGSLTQGEIIAYVNYLILILNALIVVANLIVLFTKAQVSLLRLNEILKTNSSIEYKQEEIVVNNIAPIIEFKNVSFSYNSSEEYIIKNISFKVLKGQTIGIIGGTGSGKTTIVNLLGRFYDVNEGQVLINGVNIKNYKQECLRKKVGIVPQKAVLFTGTILENLKLGNKDATEEEVILATNIAQANFINDLKDGYNSKVSKNGNNFSGGQKQRLTIARTLIKKPEILILDDSSSALDYITDMKFRKALKTYSKDTTTIIISQKINSLKDVDLIIVLEDGEIKGIGTNEELLGNCDIYKQIYLSQSK